MSSLKEEFIILFTSSSVHFLFSLSLLIRVSTFLFSILKMFVLIVSYNIFYLFVYIYYQLLICSVLQSVV